MKKTFLILSLIVFLSSCKQEDPEKYNDLLAEARVLYEDGKYELSGEKYSEAFKASQESDSTLHHYEAARAWAMANQKDLAFDQLFEISKTGKYTDLGQISSDKNLGALRTDGRWMEVLTQVSENKTEAEAEVLELVPILESVYRDDQVYRQQSEEIQEKYGRDSEEVKAHWDLINKTDSINLVKVKKILDKHGWLGWDLIGRQGNSALFLVIQHADLETQEEYLPMLREAVKRGDAAPADLALLEDRVALRQGKKQVYGSQIGIDQETGKHYVSPLMDPEHVDQRRAEVGLGPLKDYVSYWDITWNVEEYKKNLPELEAKVMN